MNKVVLFIEDYLSDFNQFSEIMIEKGYCVYPLKLDIQTQEQLYAFLHNNRRDYNILKDSVFQYIIDKKLYEKNPLIVLDINLLGEDINNKSDESGTQLLSDFRAEFYSFFKKKVEEDSRYEHWSKTTPVIALTMYDNERCNAFKQKHGNLSDALNKQDVKGDCQILISALETVETNRDNTIKYAQAQNPSVTNNHYGDNITGDKVMGNKTELQTGNNSLVTIGDENTVQSYNNNVVRLKKQLVNNYNITQSDADELGQILQDENQDSDNAALISKMKKWWGKVANYARDLSIEVLGDLLSSLLSPATIDLITRAIQKG